MLPVPFVQCKYDAVQFLESLVYLCLWLLDDVIIIDGLLSLLKCFLSLYHIISELALPF